MKGPMTLRDVIARDICELEKYDPDAEDAICISCDQLLLILEQHVGDDALGAMASHIQEMATLINRLAAQLRKAEPAGKYARLSDGAVDYLRRHGLEGSPMRGDDNG